MNPVQFRDKTVYIDGGCTPNPGIMKICVVEGERETVKTLDYGTNNEAEYLALLWALEYVSIAGDLTIYSDSQLVVNQVNGHWRVKSLNLQAFCIKAQEFMEGRPVTLEWVPREQNTAGILLDNLHHKKQNKPPKVKRKTKREYEELEHPKPKLACYQIIKYLNRRAHLKFKDFVRLKVGGFDDFSRMKLGELQKICSQEAQELIKDELEEHNHLTALRWTARGLNPHLVIYKINVDLEIRENIETKARKKKHQT